MHCLSHGSRLALISFVIVFFLFASRPARRVGSITGAQAYAAAGRVPLRGAPLQNNPCTTFTPINFGQEVNGKLETADCHLDDGSFADLYAFNGFAGQQIAITLNSAAFDAYLFLLGTGGTVIREDDDGGGGSNARIPPSGFFSLPTNGTYLIAANSFDAAETGDYTLRLTASGATLGLVSAASFAGFTFAPNSIIAAFGTDLATQTVAATTQPLPTTLGGTRVDVTDSAGQTRPAPLFFVSAQQVNFLLPDGTANGVAVVKITSGSGTVTQGAIQVAAAVPALFTANSNGSGPPAANALRVRGGVQTFEPVARFDQAQNRFVTAPIDLGPETDQVFLVLFGTGIRNRTALSAVRVTIGGADAEVLFAGPQGGFEGLDQVNARIPRSLIGRGEVDVVVTVDGRTANTVRVNIK
jgi:uncharacterized protein (TIGR03437 family)